MRDVVEESIFDIYIGKSFGSINSLSDRIIERSTTFSSSLILPGQL